MNRLLQDEMEGYECQRLSRWFASRIDAKQTVRKHHEPLSPTHLHLLLCDTGRTPKKEHDTPNVYELWRKRST
jgi:hypothetical protein